MPRYLLLYAQPHASVDDGVIAYEAERLPAVHFDNQSALRWARETVPREKAALFAEQAHLARPMVLWRLDGGGRALIWESEPGTAIRLAS